MNGNGSTKLLTFIGSTARGVHPTVLPNVVYTVTTIADVNFPAYCGAAGRVWPRGSALARITAPIRHRGMSEKYRETSLEHFHN